MGDITPVVNSQNCTGITIKNIVGLKNCMFIYINKESIVLSRLFLLHPRLLEVLFPDNQFL